MKPANILPFLIIAFIGYQFIKMRSGNPEPREPVSPGWEIIEEEAPDFNPYVDVYPTDGQSEDIPQGEPVTPPKRLATNTPKTVTLGNGFSAILNETDSFDDLFNQAFQRGEALIDIHFNRYKGAHSGPLMLYSEAGKQLAASLQREFIEIYQENGWVYGKEMDIRYNNRFALPKLGNAKKKPVVISEFGYVDDPKNPIGKWIQTEAGQNRIARAYVNALRGLGYTNVVLGIGHHGDRGSGGAKYGNYTETDFAEDVIQAITKLRIPEETGETADGYHHEENEPEPEQAGTRPPDLRKPSSNYPTYYGPNGATWNEIAPATNPTPEPEKPKRRFGLFKRKSS